MFYPSKTKAVEIRSFFEKVGDISTKLKNKELDTLQITTLLKQGTIDFEKSNTKTNGCKIYFIEHNELTVNVKNCDSIAYLSVVNP